MFMKFRIHFMEPVLGSAPNNKQIYEDFISSKMDTFDEEKENEEITALPCSNGEERPKGMTVFPHTEDGRPFAYDYQVKGMFKDACGMLSRLKGKQATESSKIKAYKKQIDGLVFVYPRQILFDFDGEMGNCQRPLRVNGPQGERVALAMSEEIPAGATLQFVVMIKDDNLQDAVREWMDYGALRGFGQWRNSGMGRFWYEELDPKTGEVIGSNKEDYDFLLSLG